jgi:hypothetical protein
MEEDIQRRFDAAMWNIYRRALDDAHYNATRFLHMLAENGGLRTARILIHATKVSEGYTALWERRRLDLTVEALIHDNLEFHSLFTDEELAIVKKRLVDYKYKPAMI